jgi:penicillin amidase
MGWNSAANLQHEIVSQMLMEKLGQQKAQQLAPVNIDPAESPALGDADRTEPTFTALKAHLLEQIFPFMPNHAWGIGSNNWVVDSRHTASGKPILANDPHLDASMLPGPWYSTGLITPDIRAVDASIPGLPGMVIGRTRGMAMEVTNAYGDAQDLYAETVDPFNPDHYLKGQVSVPFQVVHETLKFKDKNVPTGKRSEAIAIRLTRRGPVVTDLLEGLTTDKVMTIRWAAFEKMHPSIALERTLACRTIAEFRDTLRDANYIALNWVFADEN